MHTRGQTLQDGRYRIERVVGRGGMGTVYLALQPSLGDRPVAIKEMDVRIEDVDERQSAVAQFKREAELLARLDHPGLVGVTDSFDEDDRQYLVMAYIDGQTLEQAAAASPPDVSQVLDWARQIAAVLAYLHGQSPPVLVRDLKPSNVMLDRQGRIRLIDFGIARLLVPGDQTSTYIRGAGTPGYAPVEQLSGAGSNPQSDIYALGATLYRLLTRTSPPTSVALMAGTETLVPAQQLNPAVPPALEGLVHKMMALSPSDRYADATAVLDALRTCADDRTIPSMGHCLKCGTALPAGRNTCPRCESDLPTTQPAQLPPQMQPTPAAAVETPVSWRDKLRTTATEAVGGALVVSVVGVASLALVGSIYGQYRLEQLLLLGVLSMLAGTSGGLLSEYIGQALRSQMGDHRVVSAFTAALAGALAGALCAAPYGRSDWLMVAPAAGCLGGVLAGALRISVARLTACGLVGGCLGVNIWENYPASFYDNFFLGEKLYHVTLSPSDWNILLTVFGIVAGVGLGLIKPGHVKS